MAISTIKVPYKKWIQIGRYELNKTESVTNIDVSAYNEILVQFGRKNGGQAYGGMTYIDTIDNRSKPSFIPLFESNGLKGLFYAFRDAGSLTLSNSSVEDTVLFYLYAR